MKKIVTLLKKSSLMVMLIFLTNLSYGQDFFAYNGKSMTINPGTTAGFTGFKWVLMTSPAADGRTQVQLNTDETVSALTNTFTFPGTYTLRLSVKNGDGCWSEDTDKDISIFVLPEFTVTIAPDATTNGTYCENGATKTTLTASSTPDPAIALPAGVSVDVAVWYKTATAAGSLTGATQVATTGTTYAVTETAVGPHYFTGTGKYVIPAGKLITAVGDPTQGNTVTITVTAKPTTPVITPVLTN